MILSWFRQRRRRKILARPFPPAWLPYLSANVPYYRLLSAAEQAKLRDLVRIFVAERRFEACGGLEMTDEVKVTIAAQACLMALGLEDGCYDRVTSILVYPHGYLARNHGPHLGGGVVLEGTSGLLGEAHYRGPVILSWDEVLADGRHPEEGRNLVFHEFAHQLDMLDGVVNGTPPLKSSEQRRKWRQVMTAEYERLIAESEHGRATLLDQYGTTNEGEFFAVATECFFNRPTAMIRRHPRLYELFREYYRQDPAGRVAESGD
jgi:Mlc titration factor MtfA (ptsG expression regulator)